MSPKSSITCFAIVFLALGSLSQAVAAAVEGRSNARGLHPIDNLPARHVDDLAITIPIPAITSSTLVIDNFTSATVIVGGSNGNTIITASATSSSAGLTTLTAASPMVTRPPIVDLSEITVTLSNGSTIVGPTTVEGSLPPFSFSNGPGTQSTQLPTGSSVTAGAPTTSQNIPIASSTAASPSAPMANTESVASGTVATVQKAVSAGSKLSECRWLLPAALLFSAILL